MDCSSENSRILSSLTFILNMVIIADLGIYWNFLVNPNFLRMAEFEKWLGLFTAMGRFKMNVKNWPYHCTQTMPPPPPWLLFFFFKAYLGYNFLWCFPGGKNYLEETFFPPKHVGWWVGVWEADIKDTFFSDGIVRGLCSLYPEELYLLEFKRQLWAVLSLAWFMQCGVTSASWERCGDW